MISAEPAPMLSARPLARRDCVLVATQHVAKVHFFALPTAQQICSASSTKMAGRHALA